jgi:hypothetical protein
MCIERLQQLRQQHLEHSAAKRVQKLQSNAHQPEGFYEPTPEEIAAKCAEFRAEWTETEMRTRYWQQPKPVDFRDTTNFMF